MICERAGCQRKATNGKTECEHHCNSSITVMYSEWDTKRWEDRKQMLAKHWATADETLQRNILEDLLIHSHDISE